jgi:hypothetical protein
MNTLSTDYADLHRQKYAKICGNPRKFVEKIQGMNILSTDYADLHRQKSVKICVNLWKKNTSTYYILKILKILKITKIIV